MMGHRVTNRLLSSRLTRLRVSPSSPRLVWEATRELRKAFVEHERLAAMARPTIWASAGSQASRLVAKMQIN